MNFNLTEDQQAYCDAATAFANEAFKPHAARWDREHEFPIPTIKQAAALGFCGLYTQEQYGGLGLARLDASLIFERLSMGCTSTTAYLTIHNMVSWMLGRWLPAEVAEAWVPRLASGELLGSYCLTEPGAGSDAAALKSRALRTGDEYLIEGSKVFISGAGSTDVLVVMARTGGEGAGGISAFMVPADTPGVRYGKAEEKLGWHSQPTREVVFNQVRIPAKYRLGEEGEGFKFAMQALDGGRINIASCSLGTAQQALDDALAYVAERQQFGRPIGEFQSVQFRLADMATELAAARLLVRQAAAKLDENSPDKSAWCAMAKRFATDIGYQITDEALQLFGGYGYIREYPLERYLRDTRVHRILEGTNEVMRLIVARRLLASPSMCLL